MPLIELSVERAIFILVDQLESLGSGHIGGTACPNEDKEELENCPPEHFDCGEDIEDVFLRQDIIRDIRHFLKRNGVHESRVKL